MNDLECSFLPVHHFGVYYLFCFFFSSSKFCSLSNAYWGEWEKIAEAEWRVGEGTEKGEERWRDRKNEAQEEERCVQFEKSSQIYETFCTHTNLHTWTHFFDNRNQVSCGLQMGFPFIVHLAFNGTAVQRAGGCPAGTCSVKFLGRNCLHLMQTPGQLWGSCWPSVSSSQDNKQLAAPRRARTYSLKCLLLLERKSLVFIWVVPGPSCGAGDL